MTNSCLGMFEETDGSIFHADGKGRFARLLFPILILILLIIIIIVVVGWIGRGARRDFPRSLRLGIHLAVIMAELGGRSALWRKGFLGAGGWACRRVVLGRWTAARGVSFRPRMNPVCGGIFVSLMP